MEKDLIYWLNRIKSIDSVPSEIHEIAQQAVRLIAESDRLPTFVNQCEEDSLMIEYHAYPRYIFELWADGDTVVLIRESNGSGANAWDVPASGFIEKLTEILQPITNP